MTHKGVSCQPQLPFWPVDRLVFLLIPLCFASAQEGGARLDLHHSQGPAKRTCIDQMSQSSRLISACIPATTSSRATISCTKTGKQACTAGVAACQGGKVQGRMACHACSRGIRGIRACTSKRTELLRASAAHCAMALVLLLLC